MTVHTACRTLLMMALVSFGATAGTAWCDEPPLPDSRWRRWQTGALRADRLQHASLSMSAALGIGLVTEDAAIGFAASALLGVSKEIIDTRESHFDWGDLTADFIGAGLGALAAAAVLR